MPSMGYGVNWGKGYGGARPDPQADYEAYKTKYAAEHQTAQTEDGASSQEAYDKYLTSLKKPTVRPSVNNAIALEDLSRPQINRSSSSADKWANALPETVNYLSSRSSEGSEPNEAMSPQARSLLKMGVGQGLAFAGANPMINRAAGPLISLATGDVPGALRQGAGNLAGMGLNALHVPAPIIGPIAGVIAGLVSGDSERKILENAVNSGVGGLASLIGGPLGSAAYSIARMLGLNIAQDKRIRVICFHI